ncbi:MAG TPA: hypothetical protein VEZ11_12415 [Thermoanaerobaculia bacterium]|nr:hypothetical protein [Thermoanaerobaculia bacterium]
MTSRWIAIFAASGVLVLAILDAIVVGRLTARASFWYYAVARTGLFALVAISAGAAAGKFRWWNEYVGRAWTLFLIAYSLLTCSEIARRFFPERPTAKELLVAVANLALIGAYALMARSLHAAGLHYFGSIAKQVLIVVLAAALAIALCKGSLLSEIASIRAGTPHIGSLISVLADMITFLLVAPLLLTALSLRGGQMFWIFAFLTAGTFGWIVNQASASVLGNLGLQEAVRTGRMAGFALACCFISAAALTQWLAAQRGTTGVRSHA